MVPFFDMSYLPSWQKGKISDKFIFLKLSLSGRYRLADLVVNIV